MADKNLVVAENETESGEWSPARMLDPLREFGRSPFGGLLDDLFASSRMNLPGTPAAWLPRADIRETDKEYILDVVLPGVKKEDVKVEMKDDVLTVSGEKKSEKEEKGKTWLRRESSYGSFVRSFALPEGLHPEDVKASCKDGVLTLTMRKPAEVKSRGVSVKVE
ncbi:MAG: Hsp20/alpha crystallin family protein [Elusimicrobia bacterium]|nr:Hsp20/alpha crystallin family protein [Elusimicrobiota bacterium]